MRLLIVEDDLDGREMLVELFRMHDWTVTAVPSTAAAMIELRTGGFDVIISDENLEGQSGSTMLRQASAEGLLTNVGALMYTAEPGQLEVPQGVRVLRKPLGLKRLLDEAKAVAPDEPFEEVARTPSSVPPSGERSRSNLERDPFDAVDEELRMDTPMLVKDEPGHRLQCLGVDLESSQTLTALIERLDAEAPPSSQAVGESPPSSPHLR